MTITQIEVFIKIAQLNSFTKAGKELNMTQSAVSHSLSKLENTLNVQLFERSKNDITLTTIGENIYNNMKEILTNIDLVYSKVNHNIKIEPTTIKLGMFPSISTFLLPKIMKLFKQIYPQIKILLFEGTEEEIIHWTKTEVIDLGFITLPNDNFYTIDLIQDEILAILPENHKLAIKKSIKMNELIDEIFIMPVRGNDILERKDVINEELNINIEYKISNFNTIIEMVKEGIGITILPELTLKNTFVENIVKCSINSGIYRTIGIASKDKISENIIKEIFIEKVKQIYRFQDLST